MFSPAETVLDDNNSGSNDNDDSLEKEQGEALGGHVLRVMLLNRVLGNSVYTSILTSGMVISDMSAESLWLILFLCAPELAGRDQIADVERSLHKSWTVARDVDRIQWQADADGCGIALADSHTFLYGNVQVGMSQLWSELQDIVASARQQMFAESTMSQVEAAAAGQKKDHWPVHRRRSEAVSVGLERRRSESEDCIQIHRQAMKQGRCREPPASGTRHTGAMTHATKPLLSMRRWYLESWRTKNWANMPGLCCPPASVAQGRQAGDVSFAADRADERGGAWGGDGRARVRVEVFIKEELADAEQAARAVAAGRGRDSVEPTAS
ncbi:hypothetical protein OPT61_g3081 [Boeremia exigua]|uniref:Uncharacterized protein n=1 Tax=Boeremia exigua TaxID=749465 RepID=A0ACC2IJ85_9PLEO|nr:hypothetical protein OPT61_g3081 [Boeremia exigua]